MTVLFEVQANVACELLSVALLHPTVNHSNVIIWYKNVSFYYLYLIQFLVTTGDMFPLFVEPHKSIRRTVCSNIRRNKILQDLFLCTCGSQSATASSPATFRGILPLCQASRLEPLGHSPLRFAAFYFLFCLLILSNRLQNVTS